MRSKGFELRLGFAEAVRAGNEQLLTLGEWHRKREPVQWRSLQRIERIPALVRVSIAIRSAEELDQARWYQVEAQAVYEVVSQRDWGIRSKVERWRVQCALALGVPVDSGIHWEWWDFEQDWNYWFDRDSYIREIIIRGRLRAPTSGKWQTLRIPIQLSLG
ncbi:MAG: hypothetical protein KatS3mg020_0556 [Fimbriimonadales bacterium]|nr:MAG: hypothetical protein KatS3mg020_0556 [Fimbriimonadales bacterium]